MFLCNTLIKMIFGLQECFTANIHTYILFLILSISSFLSNEITGERVLTAPQITNWGEWGPFEFCPQGTYVTGMQLLSQAPQGIFRDDRGLTGIRLFCNNFGKTSDEFVIKSSVGTVGKWGKKFFCRGLMTGFSLRSEKYQSLFGDDTAGNNVRMFCDSKDASFVEGDGTSFGTWTDKQLCKSHEAICGIKTQVETDFSLDETGLNNVMMKCCDIPHPVQNCVPETSWKLVATCEALPEQDNYCRYARKFGVSYVNNSSDSSSLFEAVGYGFSRMLTQLQSKFLNISSDVSFEDMSKDSKDHYWMMSPRYIWEPQKEEKVDVVANKGSKISLYQIHGKCGMLQVWGARLKKVSTDTATKHDVITFADFTDENEVDYS